MSFSRVDINDLSGTRVASYARRSVRTRERGFEMMTTYVVAVLAILFSGCSALTWITTVRHLDPPEAEKPQHVSV